MRAWLVPALLFLAVAVATPVYSEVAGSSLALPDAATDPRDPRVNQTLVSKMVAFNGIAPGPGTKAEKDAQAGALLEEIVSLLPRVEFIRQCGLLLGAMRRNPSFAVNPMMIGYFFERRLGVTDRELLTIFLPLWADGDPSLRSEMASSLSPIDKVVPPGPEFFDANFKLHFEILAEWKASSNPLQNAMIDFMFDQSPGSALVSLLRENGATEKELQELIASLRAVSICYGGRDLSFAADSEEANLARAELNAVVADDNPWKLLFAAEIYRSVPVLRSEALEATLRKQTNPLIQSRLESATQNPAAEEAARKPL